MYLHYNPVNQKLEDMRTYLKFVLVYAPPEPTSKTPKGLFQKKKKKTQKKSEKWS